MIDCFTTTTHHTIDFKHHSTGRPINQGCYRNSLWSCYSMTDLTITYALQKRLQYTDHNLSHSDSDLLCSLYGDPHNNNADISLQLRLTFESVNNEKDNTKARQSDTDAESISALTEDSQSCSEISFLCENSSTKTVTKKKRVRFADEQGYNLTDVQTIESRTPQLIIRRHSTDTSILSNQIISNAKPTDQLSSWQPTSIIPAADYIHFRESVDQNNVCLERLHVIERNKTVCLTGSVKVKNLHYDKLVFVRMSPDKWNTFSDQYAMYQPSGERQPRYDIFYFKFPINRPQLSNECLQFAVCFKCGDNLDYEYWDNNNGKNYTLVSNIPPLPDDDDEEYDTAGEELKQHHQKDHIKKRNTTNIPSQYQNLCSYTEFRAWEFFSHESIYY